MDEAEGVGSGRDRPRRAAISIKRLMLAVACFGAIFWAAHFTRDNVFPAVGLARSLRSGGLLDRRQAAEQLGRVGPDEAGVAIPALVAALKDEDEEVRSHAAHGLGVLASSLSASGLDPAAPAAALGAALDDPSDRVRDESLLALVAVARVAPIGAPSPMLDSLARGRPALFRAEVARAPLLPPRPPEGRLPPDRGARR